MLDLDLLTSPESGFTIGFDLDLTLADTRAGISAVYASLAAETGVAIDTDLVVRRIGPPLEEELAYWFPPDEVPAMAARYREIYAGIAIPATVLMPGAVAALDAVRVKGGRVVVVSGKNQADTERTVRHLGLGADAVVGGLFGADKGTVLREHGAAPTSATTPATWTPRGPRPRWRWPWRPARSTRRPSRPTARTSSCRTCWPSRMARRVPRGLIRGDIGVISSAAPDSF